MLLSTFRPCYIVLPAALSERAYRRRNPGAMLNFPGHPGIWSWDHWPERDALSSEGERMAKITGHIRFRVREPQGCVIQDRWHMTGDIRTRTDICLSTKVPRLPHSTQTTQTVNLNQTTVTALLVLPIRIDFRLILCGAQCVMLYAIRFRLVTLLLNLLGVPKYHSCYIRLLVLGHWRSERRLFF